MTPGELRTIIRWLSDRVQLEETGAGEPRIVFQKPSLAEMEAAGLDPAGSARLLAVSWWAEMAAEVVETPEYCEPGIPPETVLRWARDVIGEWIRKRFPLESPPA